MATSIDSEVAALQDRYCTKVTDQLRRAVPASEGGLYALLRYHLGWEERDGGVSENGGGKALRPILCLMACELAGGDLHRALPAAAAMELAHNFSLIHDDIQDGDETRHNRETVWKAWDVPKAMEAGNAMRVLADQSLMALSDVEVPPACLAAASMALTTRYMEMIEGQYLDMAFEKTTAVTVDQYLNMVSRKTGALIDVAMYLGALVATQDQRVAEAFGRCGRSLGLAFQVRDDILGIWGDPAQIGKPVWADIWHKKKSLPVVYMLEQAQGEQREWLEQFYGDVEVQDADVERVLGILDELGASEYAQGVAEAQRGEALDILQKLELAGGSRRYVEAMAEYFVTRHK
jgi:geranylgeranyl diphosphate synthase type I